MESDTSFGLFGRRGPPVRSSSSLTRFMVPFFPIYEPRTREMLRGSSHFIFKIRVPPERLSNVHREVEEKPMKEQEKRETEQIIREEPDEEPVKLHSSRSDDSLSPPKRHVKHQSIIRRFDILSLFRFKIYRSMSEEIKLHHPSGGSGSAAASSSLHAADPDHQPVMRSRSFDWLPPFMPEPRPVHPAAIWERIQKFLFRPSGCGAA